MVILHKLCAVIGWEKLTYTGAEDGPQVLVCVLMTGGTTFTSSVMVNIVATEDEAGEFIIAYNNMFQH